MSATLQLLSGVRKPPCGPNVITEFSWQLSLVRTSDADLSSLFSFFNLDLELPRKNSHVIMNLTDQKPGHLILVEQYIPLIKQWCLGTSDVLIDLPSSQSIDLLQLVGVVLNWNLYGILTVQTYLYYLAFPDDRRWIKGAVYASYFLETIHTVFVTWTCHSVIESGSLVCDSDLQCGIRLLMTTAVPLAGGLAALITNVMYAWRICVITQSRLLVSGLLVLIISQLVASASFLAAPPSLWKQHWTSKMIEDVFYVKDQFVLRAGFTWLGISAACDIAIAAAMAFSLWKENILSKKLRWRVSRLIRLVIETGAATGAYEPRYQLKDLILITAKATMNIVTLVLLATVKWTGTSYISPMIVLSKVYGNAMMVLLNNRMSIPGSRSQPPTVDVTTTTTRFSTLRFQTVYQEDASQRIDVDQAEKGVVQVVEEP
ncbi:hypothetical protein AMATHDRAFT_51520 [Amanita thiersii Skay4041]|uniref:DUF6534 domain-containing protein n=1 Tax=Amanita thiersii Skay4041 TaxID=703135 RepID=A0A2A9NDA9_9AGAR|nr:hypothetical protein AMATHDRAFT_51520 [Amanita thiersii Skay4041]